MFIFENKSSLSLNYENFSFQHNYYLDFNDFGRALPPLEGEVLQLSSGKFAGNVSKIVTDKIHLFQPQHTCVMKFTGVNTKFLTLGIPIKYNGILFQHKYRSQENCITIAGHNQEITTFHQHLQTNYVISFDYEFINSLCETLHFPEAEKFISNFNPLPAIVEACPQKIKYVCQLCHQLYQIAFNLTSLDNQQQEQLLAIQFIKTKLEEEIAQKLILALAEAKQINFKKVYCNRASLLKQAEEYMINHLDSEIKTNDICQEMGISQRNLEYIFKDFYQISPKNYFKLIRLNALNQEIKKKPRILQSVK